MIQENASRFTKMYSAVRPTVKLENRTANTVSQYLPRDKREGH